MLTIISSPRFTLVSAACLSRILGRMRKCALWLAGLACLMPAMTIAQDLSGPSVKIGETDLYPEIRLDYLLSDNAFLTADDETESSGVVVSPRVDWVADRRLLTLRASYAGRYGAFEEDVMDFADHDLAFRADATLTKRKQLAGGIVLNFGHEEVGTNFTRGIADSVDEPVMFSDVNLFGNYTYGAEGARGNLIFGLDFRFFDYSNFEEETDGQGYTQVQPAAAFSYRLSPDTRFVTELRFASLTYDDDTFDRNDISLLAGVSLSETGKSGGDARIGVTQSQYGESSREDLTTFIAEVGVFYLPRVYSRLSLDLVREIDDTSTSLGVDGGDQNTRDTARLTWEHEWSVRFSTTAYLAAGDVTRNCPETDETTAGAGLELNLAVRRWLQVGASAQQSSRSNGSCPDDGIDGANLDYDRQTVGVHVRARL